MKSWLRDPELSKACHRAAIIWAIIQVPHQYFQITIAHFKFIPVDGIYGYLVTDFQNHCRVLTKS